MIDLDKIVLLAVLMVSHVPYGKVSKIGLRTARGIINTVIMFVAIFTALSVPEYYFFTVLVLYIAWGLVKSVFLGFLDRIPSGDPLLDEEEGTMAMVVQDRRVMLAQNCVRKHATTVADLHHVA